ncbi:MAG: aminotransferase class I/II-fold pyridoxal phosphate-dependent enzyme [Candidatus Aenigmarchaeota archaeon]|nr:aminotransferase class I/II-fold pyridoxal phosphate-dependent enzyme [Candidatus Aenigmarchaeota archaeon]
MQPSSRSRNLQSPIRDMVVIAKKLEAKGKKIYYFNTGDPNKFDFDVPQYLKEELFKIVKGTSGFYSDSQGDPSLIEAIVERENKKNKLDLTSDDVLITEGISEGLIFLFGALIENGSGDEILLPGPAYPPYIEWIKFLDGTPVGFRQNEEKGWELDVDDLRKKITDRTKAIVVINPNNPTGAVYDKSTLKKIVDIATENNLLLISDEIYDLLIFSDTPHVGLSSLSKDVPVIGLNGFSKNYLVPGWRCGYMFFHDPTDKLTDLKNAIFAESRQRLCACTPIMKACAAAFKGPQDHVKEMNRKLKERAEFAHRRLNEIDGIQTQKPEGAFYIFPRVDLGGKWKDDKEFCLDVLENTGLVIPYGSGFDPIYGKDHFRSVILPPIEMMEEAFSKLEEFMRKKLRKL